ncbi:MAG TPA: hypothetical protein VM164_02850, partial [Burkholderiales bacterium]|nr:hypothetical protein [Burkholderiales bacterium]
FSIAVQDDVPVRSGVLGVAVTATVEEDDMTGVAGGDLSIGNNEDGSVNKDEATGTTGSITNLFVAGADEPATTSLSLDATDLATLPQLLSQGVAVTYAVNGAGDTLTASAGGREVFTLKVNADGSWAFDLKDQLDHVAGGGENTALRTVGGGSVGTIDFSEMVVVTDADGDRVENLLTAGDFSITVQDDVPTISAGNVAIPNVVGIYEGEYSFSVGSDSQTFVNSFAPGSLVWANPRAGYELEYDAGLSTPTSQIYHGTYNNGANTFFTVMVNADGTYDFALVTADPVKITTLPSLLTGIAGGSNLPSYTIDSSVFDGQFDLVLTGYTGAHTADTLTISSTDLGVGDNVMHGRKDDVLRFDPQQIAGSNSTFSSLTIHVAKTAGWDPTDSVDVRVHYTSGADTTATQVWGSDQEVTLNFDLTRIVDWVEINPTGDASFKIDGVALSYTTREFPNDYQLNFQLSGSDADQDTAAASFTVAVNTTDTSTYTVEGTAGDDHVYGTTGSDVLLGGGGNDVLIYDPADLLGTAATVYDGGAGTDMLRFAASGQTLNLTTLNDAKIQNIEVIDLTGSGNNTLVLNDADVAALSATTNQLIVQGNAGDAVTVTGGWTQGSDQVIEGQTYATYTHGAGASMATLLIDTDVARTVT